MDTRNIPSEPGQPDDLEARIARTGFLPPPPDLRAACLSRSSRIPASPAPSPLWRRLWDAFITPHPVLATSMAAAWIAIFGLWFSTPEVGRGESLRHARVPEEYRRTLAAQRAELLASLRAVDEDSSPAVRDRAPRRVTPSATPAPRSSLSHTNRMA
jgi:hypothetical protein